MSSPQTWHVGNRDPSISETITSGDVAVDLTGGTVKFKMRAIGAATPKIDAAATIVNPPGTDGQVRYDWTANDVDTAGTYLVWWEVTLSGKTQDVGEAVIEFRDHGGALPNYVEPEQLKSTLELTGETFADLDVKVAVAAASRAIDNACDRRFYKDTVDVTRYYTPDTARYLRIHDLADFTSLTTDDNGDGTHDVTWTENTDFTFKPTNAETDGWPRTSIVVHPRRGTGFYNYPRSVELIGKFGWDSLPDAIQEATSIQAAKLLRRAREAPFGIVTVGIEGAAAQISRFDPDVASLISPYVRLYV